MAQLGDVLVLAGEVRVGLGDGLELDDAPEPGNLVEVDAYVAPEQQVPGLLDGDEDPQSRGQRILQAVGILNGDDPIVARPLDSLVFALVLDQLALPPCSRSFRRPWATRKYVSSC